MKNNREIAASVFEKSRIVLQRRAARRKKITAAASVLGVTAVITTSVLLGKSTYTQDIPINDPPSETDSAVSEGILSEPVTASSGASPKDNSHSTAEGTRSYAGAGDDKAGSAHDTSRKNTSSAAGFSSVSSDRSRPSSKSSSVSDENENSEAEVSKTTSSKATSSKATSSKATSSKTTSSKATSSKATSSKATSSKTTSSKTTSSKVTSSKTTSSKTSSTVNSYNGSGSSSNISSKPDTESDVQWYPGDEGEQPDSPAVEKEEGFVDTDIEQAIPNTESDSIFYEAFNENYGSVRELTYSADLTVTAEVESVSFVKAGECDFEIDPDIYIYDEEHTTDIFTEVTIRISDVLKGSAPSDTLTFYMYGGIWDDCCLSEQLSLAEEGKAVPFIAGRENPIPGEEYIFVLDRDTSDSWTIHNNYQSILSTVHGYNAYQYKKYSGITAADVLNFYNR